MPGFFEDLESFELSNCIKCKIKDEADNVQTEHFGFGHKRILIITSGLSAKTDFNNILSIHEKELLENLFYSYNINVERDCWVISCLGCYKDTITTKDLDICRSRVKQKIQALNPLFIFLLGDNAIQSIYRNNYTPTFCKIENFRTRIIPENDFSAYVIPLYNLFDVSNEEMFFLKKHLEESFQFIKTTTEFKSKVNFSQLNYSCDYEYIVNFLKNVIANESLVSVDLETNALYPFYEKSRIVAIGICDGVKSICFPYKHLNYSYTAEEFNYLNKLLKELFSKNDLIAHNVSFESIWIREMFQVESNWYWDTMVAEHVIFNRGERYKLKFLAHMYFGVYDYSTEIEPYLVINNSNFNKIDEFNLIKMLEYCAKDSYITFLLFREQLRKIKELGLTSAMTLYNEATSSLADMSYEGIPVDVDYYDSLRDKIDVAVKELSEEIYSSKGMQLYKQKYNKFPNLKSGQHLAEIFYNILKIPILYTTEKGSPATDEEALAAMANSLADAILEKRKLEKVNDTYIKTIRENAVKGCIHPNFYLHTTATYRSSSSKPNFQNIPIRNKEQAKNLRDGIKPRKNCQLLCVDYSSMEARIIASYSEDDFLINSFKNNYDIHMDWAEAIFLYDKDEIKRIKKEKYIDLRFLAKNNLVFPLFYKSFFGSCANNLWNNVTEEIQDYVVSKIEYDVWNEYKYFKKFKSGNVPYFWRYVFKNSIIEKKYLTFLWHCNKVEEIFWQKFEKVKIWHEKVLENYETTGYVETGFGFKMHGPITRNKIINYRIQSTAFICLLWAVNKIKKYQQRNVWQSRMIGQIHDEIITNLIPEEKEMIIKIYHKIMTQDILKFNEWIKVPLDVEFEMADINESWYNIKPISVEEINKIIGG